MATEVVDYDIAEDFRAPEAQEELLRDALEQGDAGYLAHALGIIGRARGMSKLAADTGVKRQALYRALDTNGNPTLETFLKVVRALDLQLAITPRIPDGGATL